MVDPVHDLHVFARAEVDRHRAIGAQFDRKMLRFNDIVEVGLFYGRCSMPFNQTVALEGVKEAVQACIIGDPQHVTGHGPLTMIQPWMMVS